MNLYIPGKNTLYTLLSATCDNAPNSCRIAAERCETLFLPGERVTFNLDGVRIGHDRYLDFTYCQAWLPQKLYFKDSQGWPAIANIIAQNIRGSGSLFYFDGENIFYREIHRQLKLYRYELILALRTGDYHAVQQAIVNLMGLGIGLTPTGDDYLVGLSIILFMAGSPGQRYREVFLTALEAGKEKTTLLSVITLREAIAQRYREVVYRFIRQIIAHDYRDIQRAINDIQQIGSSSGSDMLFGMADALALTAYFGGEYVYQDRD